MQRDIMSSSGKKLEEKNCKQLYFSTEIFFFGQQYGFCKVWVLKAF